jgi:hypothetical protein
MLLEQKTRRPSTEPNMLRVHIAHVVVVVCAICPRASNNSRDHKPDFELHPGHSCREGTLQCINQALQYLPSRSAKRRVEGKIRAYLPGTP